MPLIGKHEGLAGLSLESFQILGIDRLLRRRKQYQEMRHNQFDNDNGGD
jgi:hypothetical protein